MLKFSKLEKQFTITSSLDSDPLLRYDALIITDNNDLVISMSGLIQKPGYNLNSSVEYNFNQHDNTVSLHYYNIPIFELDKITELVKTTVNLKGWEDLYKLQESKLDIPEDVNNNEDVQNTEIFINNDNDYDTERSFDEVELPSETPVEGPGWGSEQESEDQDYEDEDRVPEAEETV